MFSTGPSDIENCTFSGDTSDDGGGSFTFVKPRLRVARSPEMGHSAYGGGIYNYNANMMILQCTIGGNATGTDYYGGGLYNLDGTVIVSVLHVYRQPLRRIWRRDLQ